MCRKPSKSGRRPAWISKDLQTKLRHKKEAYKRWKQERVSQGKYRDCSAMQMWGLESSPGAESGEVWEWGLASTLGGNIKSFLKYARSKRRTRDNIGLLLHEDGHLTNKNTDKVKTCNVIFVSVFSTNDGPWDTWKSQLEDHDYGKEKLPANSELVWDLLLHLDAYKSVGPSWIHPRELR